MPNKPIKMHVQVNMRFHIFYLSHSSTQFVLKVVRVVLVSPTTLRTNWVDEWDK